jgi:hypothetical protein
MHQRCCFVALGTRGDVQPVALLAQQHQLAAARCGTRRSVSTTTLVTHAAHAHWLEQLLLLLCLPGSTR